MFDAIAVYRKFVLASMAALAIAGTAVADGSVTTSEWIAIAIAALGALGVRQVANDV